MFGDLNRAEIIGNITNDVTVRYTANGAAVTSFGVATNRRYKGQGENDWKEETTFHNVVVWGNQAEGLAQRARKGTRIYVSGRMQTRTWDDKDGKKNYKTELVAENLILLDRYERGSMDGSAGSPQGGSAGSEGSTHGSSAPASDMDTSAAKAKKGGKAKKDENVIDPDDLPF